MEAAGSYRRSISLHSITSQRHYSEAFNTLCILKFPRVSKDQSAITCTYF